MKALFATLIICACGILMSEGIANAAVPPFKFTTQTYQVGLDPQGIVAGDFTGDGILDLVVVNRGDNSLSFLKGNGDGTFATPVTTGLAGGPSQVPGEIVAGDFNRDGKLDIVISHSSNTLTDGQITIYLGDGAGHFSDGSVITMSQSPFGGLAVGDLNGDGIIDLVAGHTGIQNGILVYWGRGDGTFDPPSQFDSFDNRYVLIGDLNNDGKPDIVGVNRDGANVLLNNGSGQFTVLPGPPISPGPPGIGGVALADFNGDGKLDFVALSPGYVSPENRSPGDLAVYFGTGTGGFTGQVWSYAPYGESDTLMHYGLAVADFNGDGFPDIVAGKIGYFNPTGSTRIWLNDGTGTSFTQTDDVLPGADANYTIPRKIVADFNGDGRPDLAITGGGRSITVAINLPDYRCDDFVNLSYNAGTLNMAFTLGTFTPVTWDTWLVLPNNIIPLWSVPVPVVQPSVSFNLPVPGFPSIGTVGVLTLMGNSTYGLMCGDLATVNTGGVLAAAGAGQAGGGPLTADVNGDGEVDCADVHIVWGGYGRVRGQSRFNPRADVNGDGVVDVKDLAVVVRQLPPGQKCH